MGRRRWPNLDGNSDHRRRTLVQDRSGAGARVSVSESKGLLHVFEPFRSPVRPTVRCLATGGDAAAGVVDGVTRGARNPGAQTTPPRPGRRRLDQLTSSLPRASRSASGGGRAEWSSGASAGRCMATRIFLMTASVLMMAMRRKGLPHLVHLMSMAKVRRSSSAHGI